MVKFFTPSTTKKEQKTEIEPLKSDYLPEPGDKTIEFLLNYSKSLEMINSKSLGIIDNIKN